MINASNKFGTFEYKKNKGENAIKKIIIKTRNIRVNLVEYNLLVNLNEINYFFKQYLWATIYLKGKTQVQFFRSSSSTLDSQLNSNILNLNILEKNNIVYVSLVNATMCLNSIEKHNVYNLRNCT